MRSSYSVRVNKRGNREEGTSKVLEGGTRALLGRDKDRTRTTEDNTKTTQRQHEDNTMKEIVRGHREDIARNQRARKVRGEQPEKISKSKV